MPDPIPIAYSMYHYLGRSETFIYQYLTHLRRYAPTVFSRTTANLEDFPFPRIRSVPGLRTGSPRWYAYRLRQRLLGSEPYLESAMRAGSVRLIHAHFGPAGTAALRFQRRLGVPLVTSFYGFDLSVLPHRRTWRQRYRRLFDEGDLFLVKGTVMRQALIALGCPAEKVQIQHIAVDVGRIAFRARVPPKDTDPLTLLFCGRLIPKKGLLDALEAVARIRRSLPRLEFRIIGDGPQRTQAQQKIRALGLTPLTTWVGTVSHRRFYEELDRAHVLLAPSRTAPDGDMEGGAPTVLIEAQAAGLPIVASRHCDIPEVVPDTRSGLLAPEGDHEAFAQRLLEVLTHPERWQALGRAGRTHVEADYNTTTEAPKLEARYDACLK